MAADPDVRRCIEEQTSLSNKSKGALSREEFGDKQINWFDKQDLGDTYEDHVARPLRSW